MADGGGSQTRPHGVGITGRIECRNLLHRRGNDAAARTDRRPATLNRHPLAREFCRGSGWVKPDSGLKDIMARVPMLTDRPATTERLRFNSFNPYRLLTVQAPARSPVGFHAQHWGADAGDVQAALQRADRAV